MSITRVGQQGYSYQNTATVWLVLAWKDAAPLLAVADSGQEDATFELTVDGGTRVLEAQMKTEKGPIDETVFASWLAHFPERQSRGSLLEQLRDRLDLHAIFVVTAPCTDIVAPFSVSEPSSALRARSAQTPPIRRRDAQRVLEAFAHAFDRRNPSPLEAARAADCASVAASIDDAAMCEIARRVFVIQASEAAVLERSSTILNRDFFVPQGGTMEVLEDLARLVRDANKTGHDIVAPILEVARKRGHALLLAPTTLHIPRPEEPMLLAELQQHHVLLLTGLSNAGKTRIARVLASSFQRQGFHGGEDRDIGVARRFLRDAGPEERVFVLDDPFGSTAPVADAAERLAMVRDLQREVSSHRKLIITCRADILQMLLGHPPWQIDGHTFREVSVTDAGLAKSIWEAHANASGVEPALIPRVDELLEKQAPTEVLQPGQLHQLACYFDRDATPERWLQIARQDGRDLGVALKADPSVSDVLAALRILASTALPVYSEELFFVLSGTDDLPGKHQSRGRTISFAQATDPARPAFPRYAESFEGTRSEQDAMDLLERRGLVERMNEGYRFSHPNYEEAAEQALSGAGGASFRRLLSFCTRALFCLRSPNAAHAVEALTILFDAARTSSDRQAVIAAAFEAFDTSLFPAVRDRCLIWLLRRRDLLDKSQYEEVLGAVRHDVVSADRVVWHEGEAWLDPREEVAFDDPFSANSRSRNEEELAEARTAWDLARQGAHLSPESIWSLLYNQRPEDIVPEILLRAFMYDETFIRALASKLALLCHPANEDLVRRALNDDHPQVFAAGVEGLLARWDDQDQDARRERLQHFVVDAMTPERASPILALLEHFDNIGGWNSFTEMPAEPWGLLAEPALRLVSGADRVDAGHLYHYAEQLLPKVDVARAVAVVSAWTDWAERAARVQQLGDYGSAAADLWLLITGSDSSLRSGIVARLLAETDTEFFVRSVFDLIGGWDKLDKDEREAVLGGLDGTRSDARWVRALVLMCRNPPAEIVTRLLGSASALGSLLCRQLEPTDRQLIEDCVRVCEDVAGVAQLSVTDASWNFIVRLSVEPGNHLFLRALRLCFQCAIGRRRLRHWTNRVWRALCCSADEKQRDVFFELLLEATACSNMGHFDALWRVLLETTVTPATIKRWVGRLVEVLEAIDGFDHLDIFVSDKRIASVLFKRLSLDASWLGFRRDPHFEKRMRDFVELLYANDTPRLQIVHDDVLDALDSSRRGENSSAAPDPLTERVRAARSASITLGFEQRQALRAAAKRPIDDWRWTWCDSRA